MRAAIAVGSNSTRMLAAEKVNGELRKLLRGREETRLFLGLDAEGNIALQWIEDTAQAVLRLRDAALQHGAQSVALFATSASRDARNSQALIDCIHALTGLRMRIISGEEEARLAFRAVSGLERCLVMDIGGGSTEFTIGERGVPEWSASVQLGASRLMKLCPVHGMKDARCCLSMAREILSPCMERLTQFAPACVMKGLGGSCTTAAAMLLGQEAHGEEIEGWPVTQEDAARLLALLSPMSLEERKRVPGLPASRAEHIPQGLCILLAAMEGCGMKQLRVSIRTNLDGYLLSLPDETPESEEAQCPGK